MGKHNEIGQKGEQAAAEFLEQKGYRILHRNWRYRRTELDIVAMSTRTMVFVEVKTRSDYTFSVPETAVDSKKQHRITQAAIAYMTESRHEGAIRFDILSVVLRGDNFYIDHYEDAFFFGL
ncbi:MAG: YraN family protein [Saprospiraceae bacterium]|nr:YraN family protein [Saprospiraceae bacterium]